MQTGFCPWKAAILEERGEACPREQASLKQVRRGERSDRHGAGLGAVGQGCVHAGWPGQAPLQPGLGAGHHFREQHGAPGVPIPGRWKSTREDPEARVGLACLRGKPRWPEQSVGDGLQGGTLGSGGRKCRLTGQQVHSL